MAGREPGSGEGARLSQWVLEPVDQYGTRHIRVRGPVPAEPIVVVPRSQERLFTEADVAAILGIAEWGESAAAAIAEAERLGMIER